MKWKGLLALFSLFYLNVLKKNLDLPRSMETCFNRGCYFQTQQRIREDNLGGIRYKRSPDAGSTAAQDWISKADKSQKEFFDSSKKMGESLKNIENLISETIGKKKQEYEVIIQFWWITQSS